MQSSDMLVALDLLLHRIVAQEESEELSPANLTRLTFSNTNFTNLNWTDGTKEFELNHKHYDVAAINYSANSVTVFAKVDEKEGKLLTLLDNFHKNSHKYTQLSKAQKNYVPVTALNLYSQPTATPQTLYCSPFIHSTSLSFFSPPPNC